MSDKILVLVPCYNCAPQIGRVLRQFTAATAGYFHEVLVLDNGSGDGTLESARLAMGEVHAARVTLARNRVNVNLGGSHKAAFEYARDHAFTHVAVLHGDDQGSITDLIPLLQQGLHRSHDACLGGRFMRGSRLVGYSAFRIFGNRVFNLLFSAGTRVAIKDLGSGLNVFGPGVFKALDTRTYADDLRFNIYLLLGMVSARSRFTFFPITWREDDQVSNVKMVSQALGTLKILQQYVLHRSDFLASDHRQTRHDQYAFDIVACSTPASREAGG
jgi:glycosyltransferase involved in cell wall biosynthesis